MPTNVYIDGFNLYYGTVKQTPYRWLNLEAFCQKLLPSENLNRIRYFTARVSGKVDPQAPVRQSTYLRALGTLPLLSTHFGNFRVDKVWMPLAQSSPREQRGALVWKTEEKGSDVSLASHLLLDGFQRDCDTVVLMSNDSDFTEPVRIARHELGLRVGVINPHPAHKRSRQLSADADFFKQVRTTALAQSQFPDKLTDQHGTFHKPTGW